MVATLEYYEPLAATFGDVESLTVLVVKGSNRDTVAVALGVDLSRPVDDPWDGEGETTGWALIDVDGGVLAIEPTGYGDPTVRALVQLSTDGGAAAVVRSNIQAHERFGCARDGALLFDDDEYIYIDDLDAVPAELRPLFDLAWIDLDSDDDDDDDGVDPFATGLAMAELITGIELTAADVETINAAGFYFAPGLIYAKDPED